MGKLSDKIKLFEQRTSMTPAYKRRFEKIKIKRKTEKPSTNEIIFELKIENVKEESKEKKNDIIDKIREAVSKRMIVVILFDKRRMTFGTDTEFIQCKVWKRDKIEQQIDNIIEMFYNKDNINTVIIGVSKDFIHDEETAPQLLNEKYQNNVFSIQIDRSNHTNLLKIQKEIKNGLFTT